MATHVVCPQCQQRLSLHRPAIESTKIKCRHCGSKFYAGKSAGFALTPAPTIAPVAAAVAVAAPPIEAVAAPPTVRIIPPSPSIEPPPPVPSVPSIPRAEMPIAFYPSRKAAKSTPPREPELTVAPPVVEVVPPKMEAGRPDADAGPETEDEFEDAEPGEPRRRKVKVKVAKPAGIMRWLVPVSAIGLLLAVASGFLFSNRPPPLPPSRPDGLVAPSAASLKVDSNAMFYKREMPRPQSLVGKWAVEGASGGMIEFMADGAVHLNAPMIPGRLFQQTTRWFVVKKDSSIYNLQFGLELSRQGNHQARIVEVDADTLLVTRYMDEEGNVSLIEQKLKRRP